MATAISSPQAVADELLRADQARRVRIVQATFEARRLWVPLDHRRRLLDVALNHLEAARCAGAEIDGAIGSTEQALVDLQREIDETFRQVALRHRLFADEDATEDFDDVDIDAILPPAELARRRWKVR